MARLKWIVFALLALAVAAVLAGQLGLLGGRMPDDLGVKDGRLKPPSTTPNSVSSQAALHPDHPMRAYAEIAPLPIQGDGPSTLARLRQQLQAMPGVKIVRDNGDGYLYAQCTTRWMKFIDDIELWVDPVHHVVQVRSASRVGRKDFGVNRERVEALRAGLAGKG
ncbi:DUF1499 domain-containing protein [Hydrogenophaga pseudoflava]|uniref:DUF1499 domain-containing protein n=1 Tax=Hydrogenophaga pseudoflava TaxID=47421 RepID=UPI0027E43B3D|nr:DUF1499 domain-containing protein [Hydrogenophaga pseudoflava]MDQ7743745.1 DUF1499 domain-containing protein [Hydrogenophaga pseudoflava]